MSLRTLVLDCYHIPASILVPLWRLQHFSQGLYRSQAANRFEPLVALTGLNSKRPSIFTYLNRRVLLCFVAADEYILELASVITQRMEVLLLWHSYEVPIVSKSTQ
jgi:hypothetical protein